MVKVFNHSECSISAQHSYALLKFVDDIGYRYTRQNHFSKIICKKVGAYFKDYGSEIRKRNLPQLHCLDQKQALKKLSLGKKNI